MHPLMGGGGGRGIRLGLGVWVWVWVRVGVRVGMGIRFIYDGGCTMFQRREDKVFFWGGGEG